MKSKKSQRQRKWQTTENGNADGKTEGQEERDWELGWEQIRCKWREGKKGEKECEQRSKQPAANDPALPRCLSFLFVFEQFDLWNTIPNRWILDQQRQNTWVTLEKTFLNRNNTRENHQLQCSSYSVQVKFIVIIIQSLSIMTICRTKGLLVRWDTSKRQSYVLSLWNKTTENSKIA